MLAEEWKVREVKERRKWGTCNRHEEERKLMKEEEKNVKVKSKVWKNRRKRKEKRADSKKKNRKLHEKELGHHEVKVFQIEETVESRIT